MRAKGIRLKSIGLLLSIFIWLLSISIVGTSVIDANGTLEVPDDFATIQAAVIAANPGDTIRVANGTYNENVLINKPDITLDGRNAILDGTGLGGSGILVLGTTGADISGFIIENFEVGVVLENTSHSKVHKNELKNNLSEVSTLRDGIQLVNASHNTVTKNSAHDNGHNGITVKGASTNNVISKNDANDNGTEVTANFAGCGIQLIGDGNDNNTISKNETLRNGWGIQISAASTGNVIDKNKTHENDRAGVAVLGDGSGNLIEKNDAEGNGLATVTPSFGVDLFDQNALDNTWVKNKGTSNF